MNKRRSHGLACLLLAGLALGFGAATTARAQLRAANLARVGDRITCHVGQERYTLTPDRGRIGFRGMSNETQQAFEEVERHTELTILIETIPVTNAPNAEICPGEVNYIAYNADWLIRLYNNSHSRWTLYAVIAHEIGHYTLAHDRRASRSNPRIELEADEYAGRILAKMGAPLSDALDAYRSMPDPTGGGTHPPVSQRLEAVEKGWSEIRGRTAPSTVESAARPSVTPITHGPVELTNRVYKGGPDNEFQFKFKITTVRGNTSDYLKATASRILDLPGSHVWRDGKKYYWRRTTDGDNLLLAWKNLSAGTFGWVVVQYYNGRWFYKTNAGEWTGMDRGTKNQLKWDSSGESIKILLFAPKLSNGWTAADIQYSFG